MKTGIQVPSVLLVAMLVSACGSSPYRYLAENEIIESRYVTYVAPDAAWEVSKNRSTDHWSSGIHAWLKGVTYDITVQSYPYSDTDYFNYFDKSAEYVQVRNDNEMKLGEKAREQGIGYVRQWTSYAMGLKCVEGVFSRNSGGFMASVTSKNYGISCGYYHKTDGRRVIDISYRYNYAGGPVRHEADKDTPREELLTLEQAEMGLKQAVKKIVTTLQIKNMDRERMQREGLLYEGRDYVISPF